MLSYCKCGSVKKNRIKILCILSRKSTAKNDIPMTKSSRNLKAVCEETGCQPKKVRYKSIPSHLRTNLKPSAAGMTSVFEEYAISHGMFRRVVSLAANSVLLGSQLVIDDWFHFYLDVWSAVTFFFSPAHMSANHLKPAIDRFFADAAPSAYMKKTLAFKTPALARQHECTTMSENAKLHESFSATRGRSADRTTLNAYAHVAFDTFEVMATELTHTGRAIARWQSSRSLQRFLATVTNRIFQNASTRMLRSGFGGCRARVARATASWPFSVLW